MLSKVLVHILFFTFSKMLFFVQVCIFYIDTGVCRRLIMHLTIGGPKQHTFDKHKTKLDHDTIVKYTKILLIENYTYHRSIIEALLILKLQPSINKLQPSINKLQPSINKLQPSINKLQPSINKQLTSTTVRTNF